MLTGALKRAAYYGTPVSPTGASPRHGQTIQAPDDVFTPPLPAGSEEHSGDVWADPPEQTAETGATMQQLSHTGIQATPVGGGVADWRVAGTAAMIAAHGRLEYEEYSQPVIKNATQAVSAEWVPDQGPLMAGIQAPEWMVTGPNGYDFSNPSTPMYDGGRYRLGRRISRLGGYEFAKVGQDAELRAVAVRQPYLPQDTPNVPNPVGRTVQSSGTSRWVRTAFNVPQLYTQPGKDDMTSVALLQQDGGQIEYQGGGEDYQ